MNNIEKSFIEVITELTDLTFYVKTDAHSSGFNLVSIEETESYFEDEETSQKEPIYLVSEENEPEEEMTFFDIMKKYPSFTLSKEFAYYNRFESWDRYKASVECDLKIVLIEI